MLIEFESTGITIVILRYEADVKIASNFIVKKVDIVCDLII